MSTMDKNIQFLYGKGLTNNVPFSAGAIYLDTLNKQLWYDDPAGEITEHTLLTTPDEIYVGNGEMPDDATIQILMDDSDEEQSFKDELKDYIDGEIEKVTPVKGVDYFDGTNGKTAYQYAQEGGYEGTEAEFSEDINPNTVKAHIAQELAKRAQLKPEFANDVSECTDESKLYVLPDGMVWAYMNRTTTLPSTNPNLYIVEEAVWNGRLSGSSGSLSTGANNSCTATGFIALTDFEGAESFIVRINGVNFTTGNRADDKVVFYNSAKTRIGNVGLVSGTNITYSESGAVIDLKAGEIGGTYDGAAYIRIQFSTAQEEHNGLTITFDTNYVAGGTTTQIGWYSTGHAFVPADYEDRINALEDQDDLLNQAIYELQKSLGKTNTDIEIPLFWEDAVNECISKIKSLQVGRHCVTFPFFSDNHTRNGYAGVLIARIMKECNIPYAFFGGDSISSGYIASEAVMIAQDKAFDEAMSYIPNGRFCRAVGNHDGFWNVSEASGDEYHYTRAQIYELFLREESIAQNKHFGEDGTYYYVDDIASRTRFIVLNTNDGNVDSTQLSWLQNTALSFNESGWTVVFISHHPISNHYHANISNAEEVRTIVKSYINGSTANKADIVGWFSGHIHMDRIYTGAAMNTTDDSVGADMGFKQVTITSDHTGIAYDDRTKHTVANDDQSHAIDFVTINKTTRTVNITRLGIGNDRHYTY